MHILPIWQNSLSLAARRQASSLTREPALSVAARHLSQRERQVWFVRKGEKKRQNRSVSDSDVFCIFPKLLVRVLDGGDAVCTRGDDEVGAVEEEAGLQNTEGALEKCFHGCIVLTKL